MANNFLSIQNRNPLLPSMPFIMPPVVIAPVMMPGIPGLVPMVVPMMNPGQMPTNLPGFLAHNTAPTYSQAYHRTLGPIHANSHHPPRIPAPVAPTSKRITSQSEFHSLVVKKLLKYIEEKARKDSKDTELIDLVSDDEEEEEINVVDSPRIENSMLDVTTPEDSGRFSGEPDSSQADETACLDNDLPSNSEAPIIMRKRKYNKYHFVFTPAQIEFLESLFLRNGTITTKEVNYLADGDELREEQIKKWLKSRRAKRLRATRGKNKKMEKSMMELESDSGDN